VFGSQGLACGGLSLPARVDYSRIPHAHFEKPMQVVYGGKIPLIDIITPHLYYSVTSSTIPKNDAQCSPPNGEQVSMYLTRKSFTVIRVIWLISGHNPPSMAPGQVISRTPRAPLSHGPPSILNNNPEMCSGFQEKGQSREI